jgi:hypothetical protein
MPRVLAGSSDAQLVAREKVGDSRLGSIWQDTYRGPEASIMLLALGFQNLGLEFTWRQDRAYWLLTVRYGYEEGATETPQDTWELVSERNVMDLWAHPRIAAALSAQGDSAASTRAKIQQAVDDGKAWSTVGVTDEHLQEAYRLLLRGATGYDLKRPVLRRVRTYSARYATRIVIRAIEQIFTTSKIVAEYSIPSSVQAQLPTDPSEIPDGTVWAWKESDTRATTIPRTNRIEETIEWTFAAWSRLLYDLAG